MSSKRNWNNKKAEFAEHFLGEGQRISKQTDIRKKRIDKKIF